MYINLLLHPKIRRVAIALSLILLSFGSLRAAITDSVDFNSGTLADTFSDNVLFGGSPYSLAANGLNGSAGINFVDSTASEGTLVFRNKGFDLATISSLEVSCFLKRQAITSGTHALNLGLTGTSSGHLSGVVGDAFVGLRLSVSSGAWALQFQSKGAATASPAASSAGATFSTVVGNWYHMKVTYTRVNSTTIQALAVVSNASDTGVIGSTVATFGTNYSLAGVGEIAGDRQVWVAVRGIGSAGIDELDNLQITANGVNAGIPAAPVLAAAGVDAYRVALSWADQSVNEDSFVVMRSTASGGPYTDIATLPANTTSYADASANRGLAQYYRIRAVSTAGSTLSNGVGIAAHQSPYRWKNVAIGGGGYVTGIFLHPTEPNLLYIRTDVGGFYRWDAANTRWLPLMDFLTLADKNHYGGEGLALDRNNPNAVYVACGKYASASFPVGAIYKSLDRGNSWTKLPLNSVRMGGNEDKRSSGERLVVSPHDSNVVLFGSRNDGLLRSTDGGQTWGTGAGFSGTGTALVGISAVAFDPQAAGVVYASLFDEGIYRSTDNGATWALLAGSPVQVNRMTVSSSGVLFATHNGGVSKYAAGSWTLSVPGGTVSPLYGLSVNPTNSNDLLVAEGTTTVPKIYRSVNGGGSWTLQTRTFNGMVPWYMDSNRTLSHMAAIEFDPQVPGRVWTTDWFTVSHTDNINASPAAYFNEAKGHEEVVALALLAPASGAPLLSGVADVDGFRHANGVAAFPSQRMNIPGDKIQETYCIAASESDPSRMVRCAGNRTSGFQVLTSADGGASWATTTWNVNFPTTLPLRVAVSAMTPENFVVISSSAAARVTTDNGVTWQTVSGLPNGPGGGTFVWMQPLTADRQLGGTFYYHDGVGKTYRSTNQGLIFSQVNSSLATQSWSMIKALPGIASEVWVSLDFSGLQRSTNGGTSFSKITSVDRAYLFAFGKPAPSSTTPTLYLYGRVNGSGDGIYRSADLGQTWTDLTDPRCAVGNSPCVLDASMQTYGLVFIGTNGRGIFAGQPLATVNAAATAPAAELALAPGTFTVTRDGDPSFDLEVSFTLGGTATRSSDYTASSVSATIIPAGSASTTVTITPLADTLAEGDETITLGLSETGTYVVGTPATLTLADKPFDAWRKANGLTSASSAADTDGDGVSDWLEYALGSAPNTAQPSVYPIMARDGGQLTLTYPKLRSPLEATWTVEVTSDLVHWDNGPTYVSETLQPDGVTVIARDLAPADSPRRFIRLRVDRVP